MNNLAIGLVVKGGKQFIDKWIESAERISDTWLIVDNDADPEVRQKLISHPSTKQYLYQKDMGRNNSRDYQKILEMAREENVQWVWNIDIDEIIPDFDRAQFFAHSLNTESSTIGFPLFEMRGDDEHYIMVPDNTDQPKHGRLCHKCYKVLSHFEFDKKDAHGRSIPHNAITGELFFAPIKHLGHMTKELRDEKRSRYKDDISAEKGEQTAIWLEEDESKIIIKKWEEWKK